MCHNISIIIIIHFDLVRPANICLYTLAVDDFGCGAEFIIAAMWTANYCKMWQLLVVALNKSQSMFYIYKNSLKCWAKWHLYFKHHKQFANSHPQKTLNFHQSIAQIHLTPINHNYFFFFQLMHTHTHKLCHPKHAIIVILFVGLTSKHCNFGTIWPRGLLQRAFQSSGLRDGISWRYTRGDDQIDRYRPFFWQFFFYYNFIANKLIARVTSYLGHCAIHNNNNTVQTYRPTAHNYSTTAQQTFGAAIVCSVLRTNTRNIIVTQNTMSMSIY